MPVKIEQPYPLFRDKLGFPLGGGLIYIGVAGLNPETNLVTCYFDEDFTLVAPQPLRTINGYISRNGSPANIFLKVPECSITIKDRFRITQYTDLNYQLSNFGAINAVKILDESGLTQQQVNNGVESISDLVAISNPKNGNRQYVKSYNAGQGEGGGYFIYDSSLVDTNNGSTIFNGWVRVNFNILTPEMCGAFPQDQDNTIPIERFLIACGTGIYGQGKSGKTYKTNRFIDATYSKSVNIDWNGCTIKPHWNIVAGYGVDGSIRYKSSSGSFTENVSVNLSNIYIDLTSFIPSITTNGSNKRGIRGLMVDGAEYINISNYNCKGAFFGSGLYLSNYRKAILNSISLPDCGTKFNPTVDDVSALDAAGDALYLGEANGHATTIINGMSASSQSAYIGRCGIAVEQFTGSTLSHLITLNSVDFDGYQRIIHQEDRGFARVLWSGGSAKRFSNLLFNLAGSDDINYLNCTDVSIDVNPPFPYGGTSGVTNFQAGGDAYFENCNIDYISSVTERGNKFITGGAIKLNNSIVDHAVSSKTHTLTRTNVTSTGGYLYFTPGNKGVIISGGSMSGVAGSLTGIVRSSSNQIKINGSCKLQDCSVFAENTLTLGRDKNIISDCEITYTGTAPATLFSGSYDACYKLSDVKLKSDSARMELYGEGATRYSIQDCELVNVGVNVINAAATNPNGILKIRNSELYYNDAYGSTSVIPNSYGTIYAVMSDNMIFDATTAQNISLPAASASIKLDNNNFVKGGVIS